MILSVTIPGAPVSWARTATYQGRRLTPKAQRAYQQRVGYAALAARPAGWPLDARYSIGVVVSRDRRKADWDNAVKTLCDALNGIAWTDDSQVDEARVVMRRGPEPHGVEIVVRVIGGDE